MFELTAQSFVAARRQALALSAYPGVAPVDMAQAYAIQDRALALDGRPVAGWKVGRINAPDDARLGTNRLAGPIFADTVITDVPGTATAMPVFVGGFAAVEAEFMLHVAPGHGGEVPTSDSSTLALLDAVHIGMEIASSPYRGINADGPPVTASDFGNNNGLIIGPAVPDWRSRDLCAVLVRTEIDGVAVGEASAATMLDGPLGAVRFLLGNLASRGIDTSAGLWVSTGAITGVHQVSPGQSATASFAGIGALACRFVPAMPG